MTRFKIFFFLLLAGFTLKAQDPSQILQNIEQQQERSFKYFYIEAERAKLWGNNEEAFKYFQQCLQYNQDNALIYYELSNLFFSTGQNQEGFQMLQKAVELKPDNQWYSIYLANLYLQTNQLVPAVELFEHLSANDPKNKMYLYRLAQLHTELKNYDKAIEDYKNLESILGDSEMVEMELRRLYSLTGQQQITIEQLKKEIKENPDEPMNYVLLGDTYLEIQKAKDAYKNYQKSLKIDPSYGGTYLSLANYYQATHQTDKMFESLEEAFKSSSLELDSKKQVFLQLMMKAEKDSTIDEHIPGYFSILDNTYHQDDELQVFYGNYLITKNDSTGYQYLEQSLVYNPYQQEVWLQVLGYYLSQNNIDRVEETCNSALSYYPQFPELYFYKSLVLNIKEDYANAISVMKSGLPYAANRQNLLIRMLTTIGDLYYQENDLDSTFYYYDQVLSIDENNIMVLNNYAYFLAITDGDLAKAEDMSAKTIQLEPGNSTYLDTYAWILYLKGDKFLSKFYIEQALTNMTEPNGEILEHYGYILKLNEDYKGARVQWEKAIEMGWNTETLSKEISELP